MIWTGIFWFSFSKCRQNHQDVISHLSQNNLVLGFFEEKTMLQTGQLISAPDESSNGITLI